MWNFRIIRLRGGEGNVSRFPHAVQFSLVVHTTNVAMTWGGELFRNLSAPKRFWHRPCFSEIHQTQHPPTEEYEDERSPERPAQRRSRFHCLR